MLLAKLAGAMKASLSGAAATFAALPAQMARLLAALEEKRGAEAPATAAAAGTEVPAREEEAPEAAEATTSDAGTPAAAEASSGDTSTGDTSTGGAEKS